ncbi:cytochrome c biogenesis CcdA family protein [Novosphingobium lentum]|uniref:cytochrome c biogenesis CcdA family protein n=1 Tax=Novosphingobium lentum TaxID=145287 RepID=UPI000830607B|nr:cytochrome c biogenesis CcdA family protein [Novosphingobium lentum]
MAGALNPLLGFAAGGLTILSPCVLPLVPVVLGSAAQANPRGPLALAAGLILSFTLTGLAVATLGSTAGFDPDVLRNGGAVLLIGAGVLLVVQRLQDWLTLAAGPFAAWAHARQAGFAGRGLAGQAAIGVLLGLVWSPCVGPTLGAAIVLAAQGKDLLSAATTMVAFGLGIAAVLLVIAYGARSAFARRRSGLMMAGKVGKRLLGGVLVAMGTLIVTGGDRLLEGVILSHLPPALVDFSVQV